MLMAPYADAEFRNSSWSGVAVEFDAVFAPLNPEQIGVTVDGLGNFVADTSSTGALPLAVFDANTGEIRGDSMDPGPPPETGTLVALATPDRLFLAIFSCPTGTVDPLECDCAALLRD